MEKTMSNGLLSPPGAGPERALRNKEESEGPAPGGRPEREGVPAANPEVLEKPVRRRFTAQYKLRILSQADEYGDQPGKVGELLRCEGLYASHLSTWRKQRQQGTLAALTPKKRGRKSRQPDPLAQENQRLRRENDRLAARLRQAEAIIDVQKKVSEILGIPLKSLDNGENV
jgi:transposase-like protein